MTAESAAFAMLALVLGLAIGIVIPRAPAPIHRPIYQCPVAHGQEIISSEDSAFGQFCTYASSYGRATHKLRVAKP